MALTTLLGGARSGKSTLALRQAKALGRAVTFVATAQARDAEMADRIARHRAERAADWTTVEAPLDLGGALASAPADATVIVDCLSLWVANLIERGDDDQTIERLGTETAELAASRAATTIAVSNEVGMGVVPAYELGRRYRDVLGRVNATWVDHAAEAALVVAGRPLTLRDGASRQSLALRARRHGEAAELIRRTLTGVTEPDTAAEAAARAALDAKTKPRGSLGRLEELACQVAAIRGRAEPGVLAPALVVCAADHGYADEGVSAYPQEVTGQMLLNFASGGAAVCVLARQAGARLVVADLGVREPVEAPGVLDRRVRAGTANAARGPAMTTADAERSLAVGIEIADELIDAGVGILALGEMGIANTTAASALTAALLRADPSVVCGRGTGLDDEGVERKVATVRRALAANDLEAFPANAAAVRHTLATNDLEAFPADTVAALAAVGGLEIAALAGLVLGCAARRTPVLLDGFITTAAALVAVRIEPRCQGSLLASHRSPEPGHRLLLEALALQPLLELNMRLGEGSGAALALPIVASALAILSDMATFDDAGVTDSGA